MIFGLFRAAARAAARRAAIRRGTRRFARDGLTIGQRGGMGGGGISPGGFRAFARGTRQTVKEGRYGKTGRGRTDGAGGGGRGLDLKRVIDDLVMQGIYINEEEVRGAGKAGLEVAWVSMRPDFNQGQLAKSAELEDGGKDYIDVAEDINSAEYMGVMERLFAEIYGALDISADVAFDAAIEAMMENLMEQLNGFLADMGADAGGGGAMAMSARSMSPMSMRSAGPAMSTASSSGRSADTELIDYERIKEFALAQRALMDPRAQGDYGPLTGGMPKQRPGAPRFGTWNR